MKKIILSIGVLLLSVGVTAQQKQKEVKQETEVKTVRVNDGEKISEKKVKVITREEADVELDAMDENKVNQKRIPSTPKVEKTVMVDNDSDYDYDTLSKVSYYKSGDSDYMFSPIAYGFDISKGNTASEYEKIGTAWVSHSKGHYIINGDMHDGIGYFDDQGNLVIEYYSDDSNKIEAKTYIISK
tara:strand:- start:14595 stop:15149 length:555 start_codon:yes stop_codon:yes gene_type:complete